jgi:serine/threonine protein kinase
VERGDLSGAILDGRYRVIEPIAEGAMGVVYRAERIKLGRIVAIKVLHDVLPNELSGRKRFEIEAMAMAKLEHPHCASVLDVGVHNDKPFVVMDFVSGQNLRDLIAKGPQPIPRAAEIVRQVLSGLAHAHEHGIVHRDIKPANIVLSQKTGLGDHVKILDFGLARLHASGHSGQNLTSGIVVGTPAYMAPEQIRGDSLDHRADLYACGVLLFELLTGQKPYHSESDDPIEVCRMHLNAEIPRLDARLPGTAFGELEAVTRKALAKRSDDRYGSAQDFAAALDVAAPRRSTGPLTPIPHSGPIAVPPALPHSGPAAVRPALPHGGPAAVRPAIPHSGPTAVPRAVDGPDTSYPPAVEVRTADVLSAIPADASQSAGDGIPAESASPGRAGGRSSSASGPGTFFGLAVTPTPRAQSSPSPGSSSGSSPRSPADRKTASAARPGSRRWRWVAALAVVALAGGGGLALVATRDGAASPEDTARRTPPSAQDPGREIAARATELAAQGDRDAALDLIAKSRRQHPDSAPLAYAAGRIFFSKFYWTDGLKSFRDAIRLDPGYRTDRELIKAVLRGFITTPGYNDELAAFLRDDIGAATRPFLEETARDHPNPAIRSRAANELRRYR